MMRAALLGTAVVWFCACATAGAPDESDGGGAVDDADDGDALDLAAGGSDGVGGASASTASSSSTGATTGATSGSGGGTQTCDGTHDCGTCESCAVGGPCQALYQGCMNNDACVALNTCLSTCPPGDQACQTTCADSHPDGQADLMAASSCVFCDVCYADCNGAAVGCI